MTPLRRYREAVGLSQQELATKAKTSQPQIQRLERGERKLTKQWALRLAPHLGCHPHELVFDPSDFGDVATPATKSSKILWVPLFDRVAAGKLRSPVSQIPISDVPLIAFADLGRGEFFALEVDGDSVDRVAPEGSIAVVNKTDRTLINGKFYVFAVKGRTTLKMWQAAQGSAPAHLAPYSWNPTNKPIFFKKSELEVIGRVKRTLLDL